MNHPYTPVQPDATGPNIAEPIGPNEPGPRPSPSRTNTFEKAKADRKRYILTSVVLVVSLASYVLQTEAAGYMATTLRYRKPFFTMYVTHGSWVLMAPLQALVLRLTHPKLTTRQFLRRHWGHVRRTTWVVSQPRPKDGNVPVVPLAFDAKDKKPFKYLARVCLVLCVTLNIGGSAWYIAVNWTTPNDLTAIYNCSAFFAYAFSVPLLHEKFRWDKALAVAVAMLGVVVIAYAGSASNNIKNEYPLRTLGNAVIAVGAVLYGLYEVLYKRLASAPPTLSAKRQAEFANIVATCIGVFTLGLLWVLLIIFHLTGLETFELPSANIWGTLMLSVLGNVLFCGSFLTLMTLTSPVFGSVAALLTTFLVPLVDWWLFGTQVSVGDVVGGLIIISAFALLAYASWRELQGEGDEDDSDDEE